MENPEWMQGGYGTAAGAAKSKWIAFLRQRARSHHNGSFSQALRNPQTRIAYYQSQGRPVPAVRKPYIPRVRKPRPRSVSLPARAEPILVAPPRPPEAKYPRLLLPPQEPAALAFPEEEEEEPVERPQLNPLEAAVLRAATQPQQLTRAQYDLLTAQDPGRIYPILKRLLQYDYLTGPQFLSASQDVARFFNVEAPQQLGFAPAEEVKAVVPYSPPKAASLQQALAAAPKARYGKKRKAQEQPIEVEFKVPGEQKQVVLHKQYKQLPATVGQYKRQKGIPARLADFYRALDASGKRAFEKDISTLGPNQLAGVAAVIEAAYNEAGAPPRLVSGSAEVAAIQARAYELAGQAGLVGSGLHMLRGGNFFSDLWSGIKKGAEFVSPILNVAKLIPGVGQAVVAPISAGVELIRGAGMSRKRRKTRHGGSFYQPTFMPAGDVPTRPHSGPWVGQSFTPAGVISNS